MDIVDGVTVVLEPEEQLDRLKDLGIKPVHNGIMAARLDDGADGVSLQGDLDPYLMAQLSESLGDPLVLIGAFNQSAVQGADVLPEQRPEPVSGVNVADKLVVDP